MKTTIFSAEKTSSVGMVSELRGLIYSLPEPECDKALLAIKIQLDECHLLLYIDRDSIYINRRTDAQKTVYYSLNSSLYAQTTIPELIQKMLAYA